MIAAVRGGLVNSLVTHSTLAHARWRRSVTPRSPGRRPAVEIPLLGGTANRGRVHRVGDTVRRPLRPTSAGRPRAAAAPGGRRLRRRAAGAGRRRRRAGRCSATCPGEAVTAPAPGWGLTDAALHSVGRLLRRFHDAAAGLRPDARTPGRTGRPPPFDRGGIAHNDPNLDNVVFRDGRAVALIDFDLAAPGRPAVGRGRRRAAVGAAAARPPTPPTTGGTASCAGCGSWSTPTGWTERGPRRAVGRGAGHHDWMYALVRDGAGHGVPGFAAYWGPEAAARARRTDAWLGANAGSITSALLPP